MGSIKGFMENERETPPVRPVEERLQDQKECYAPFPEEKYKKQGARCMDCGVPFCQSETGCPLGNLIPDWNDMVYAVVIKKLLNYCLRPIIFRNSLVAFARLPVKEPVCWELMNRL